MDNGESAIKEVIDIDLLLSIGAVYKRYEKDEYVFHEGQMARFYYQIAEGRVKMVNEAEGEKDFIQGFFSAGQSFGEPPIFANDVYPASAIAEQPSLILRLAIPSFVQLLKENLDVHWKITQLLAERIRRKAISLKEISCHSPEHRILSLLDGFKKELLKNDDSGKRVKIDYTRQQIANMTGLRVETVIRVVRNLCDKNILIIEKGKVFY